MDSSITSGFNGGLPIQQPSFPKREQSAEAAVVPAVPMTTIPKLHQTQEQSLQELEKAIQAIQGPQKSLEISMHEKTHAIMIKVLNKETGDVIREVPSEKILDVVAKMMEHSGILVDKRV
ncbi:MULTISPECIES: flagellar protein FlaG [Saccharibacillus]|uniref:flagellar protein FlaG n=1 Tax=Saccharibacillus TaxID=456492 RepID=UPI00123AEEAC|nr:flagellar protein FlaG [Saccharibacillus sp. WB 17]MWJ33326.1 flagellar biosynthesis protein FlaG [Saccharibacillus sp. WB 17]